MKEEEKFWMEVYVAYVRSCSASSQLHPSTHQINDFAKLTADQAVCDLVAAREDVLKSI